MSATPSQVNQPTSRRPQILALVLAIGGCFWGVLMSPFVFTKDVTPLALAVFGPGYVVTLGYIIRAASTPPLPVRQVIWSVSVLVQGAWLAWFVWAVADKLMHGGTFNEPLLLPAWWTFATVASLVGLVTEKPDRSVA